MKNKLKEKQKESIQDLMERSSKHGTLYAIEACKFNYIEWHMYINDESFYTLTTELSLARIYNDETLANEFLRLHVLPFFTDAKVIPLTAQVKENKE